MLTKHNLQKLNDHLWEIPQDFRHDMRVPARVYASEKMLDDILGDKSLEQLVNVATLPGISHWALAMPDAHEGYGFPIGGVAAFDLENGVISPGGIGYDINCGVRLLYSSQKIDEVRPHLDKLNQAIYREAPSGVGKGGRLKLKGRDLDAVLGKGAERMVELGYGEAADLKKIESGGRLADAAAAAVSEHAKARGADQLGTLGAGNHFIEIEEVETVYDEEAARTMGLFVGQAVVLIHTGSRGLGHQVATDYIRVMMKAMPKYNISLPDRELACAPFQSPEGQNYWRAMSAAANFAWANRQMLTWEVRQAWMRVLGGAVGDLRLVYDVAHNIAKIEEYEIDGAKKKLIVHRKGATRSFPELPVIIPGSMGTASYVLLGQERALSESFGSTCHGAGRAMSRTRAKKQISGAELKERLRQKGITVNAGSLSGLAEEAPEAYKNVDEVVDIIHAAGIARRVARLRPAAVVKG